MEAIFPVLIFLFVFFVIVILFGHGSWLVLAWFFRKISGKAAPSDYVSLSLESCPNCRALLQPGTGVCVKCGWQKMGSATAEIFKEIGATQRQLQRLHSKGSISKESFQELTSALELERERLAFPGKPNQEHPSTTTVTQAPSAKPSRAQTEKPAVALESAAPPPDVLLPVTSAFTAVGGSEVPGAVPSFSNETSEVVVEHGAHLWAEDELPPPRPRFAPVVSKANRPVTEVLAAFMEQSNIRWGEIIGGLLIIGCSTALVISLWNEISRIPLLKFFIFTSVTASLFGIGLYTEHRWKLPTTSRGILTIATLLVPLNFLAIAAVSSGTGPSRVVVLASELFSPALFFCLVYFAGRIIAPNWPHLLVFGVLGSSIGQLVERHYAYSGIGTLRLVGLGLFPVACFVGAIVWMLWRTSRKSEIDEGLANTIFVTLGASTFALLLSLGLLLFKVGQARETLIHLAPLLSFGGGPILVTGLTLWQRVRARELSATRTAGTTVALFGAFFVFTGIALSFPNPTSVVAASFTGFVVLSCAAVISRQPRSHLLASLCFTLGFVVFLLAVSGQVTWQSPHHTSLLSDLYSARSGQALSVLFVLYLAVSEALDKRNKQASARYYMVASSVVGGACLALVTRFGLGLAGDPHLVAPIYTVLALGSFYIAWRQHYAWICWIASGVALLAFSQTLGPVLGVRFPWQTALLTHASVTAVAALLFSRRGEVFTNTFERPLNGSALIASCLVIVAMIEAYRWEPTAMYAQRLLWLAGIWLVLLWLNRSQLLFNAMQIALTWSVILAVKLGLQNFAWYGYVRNAWLHPWSLQIQGGALLLLGLAWIALRIILRRRVHIKGNEPLESNEISRKEHVADVAWTYLHTSRTTFDRVVIWVVLACFVVMSCYGALQGIKLELTIRGGGASVWNLGGFPHEHVTDAGAWLVLGLLIVTMIVSLWERRKFVYVLGAMVSLCSAVPLLAARWETSIASASAWRWFAAVFLLLLSSPLWWRTSIIDRLKTYGWPEMDRTAIDPVRHTRLLLLILTIVPVLTLTLFPTLKAISYRPIHGPAVGFFYVVGDVVSYSFPLMLIGLVLVFHTVRERAAGYAFAAGVFFNLSGTVAQLLTIASASGLMNRVVLIQVMQLNIIASSGFALVWIATRGWWGKALDQSQSRRSKSYLKFQIGLGLVLAALIVVPLVLSLSARPTWVSIAIPEAGSFRGWLAIVLAFLAAFWSSTKIERALSGWLVFLCSGAVGSLIAFTLSRWHGGTWAAYHALLAASVVTAWIMLFATRLPESLKRRVARQTYDEPDSNGASILDAEWKWDVTLFASIAGAWVVLLALRGAPSDTSRPWWSVGALIAISVLAAGLNWETLSRGYLYAAAVLANLAASIWYVTYWSIWNSGATLIEFLNVNIIALSLPGIAWLWLELRARKVNMERRSPVPSFHHAAGLIALGTLALIVFAKLAIELLSKHIQLRGWLTWLAVFSAILLMAACLWDRRARYAVVGLYILGMIAIGNGLVVFGVRPDRLAWVIMLSMASYAVMTSLIWRSRDAFITFAGQVRIPPRTETQLPGLAWLTGLNAALVSSVIILAHWIVLRFAEWPMRFSSAVAVGAQSLAFGVLAQGEKRGLWQRAVLFLLALGAVFFGWAWLEPGDGGTWLNRAVILMMVMFGMIAIYGFGTDKAVARESDWTHSARSTIPWLAATGALALLFILATEVSHQSNYGNVQINFVALVVVAVTLLAASTLCIFFAVKPSHDPLELSETGRMKYVYVAEALVALLFMHIRLTMPWLFTGFFEQYWPMVIVFLAFVGVGVSEALRRQGVQVVAQPVEKTGAFLPLLPVIGFWIVDSRVDYSLVLFAIGLLYASLSILRRSFAFGILAALAGNGGLWYMLHQTASYGFAHHPQLWIIPVAVCVLIAAYLNRESYSNEQMATIRYVSLMMIYVSSTSDILINGVSESPWLPLALGGLSLVGVLSGILLRVRAFLFLGATFLLIAVISMIWYASDNLGWTWLWWVAGIVTGALIIFTFALFEKKRGEMLQVLEDLRGWQK